MAKKKDPTARNATFDSDISNISLLDYEPSRPNVDAAPEAPNDRGMGVQDTFAGLASGAVGLAQDLSGLVGAFTNDDPNTGFLDENLKKGKDYAESFKSREIRGKEAELQRLISDPAYSVGDVAAYLKDNPSVAFQMGVESLPGTVAIAAGGAGLAAKVGTVNRFLSAGGKFSQAVKAGAFSGGLEGLQTAGGVYNDTQSQGAAALAFGLTTLTGVITPGNITSAAINRGVRAGAGSGAAELGEQFADAGLRGFGRSAMRTGGAILSEAGQEATQTVAEARSKELGKGGEFFSGNWDSTLKEGFVGGVLGGAMGGVSHPFVGHGGMFKDEAERAQAVRAADLAGAVQEAAAAYQAEPTDATREALANATAIYTQNNFSPDQANQAADITASAAARQVLTSDSAESAIQAFEAGNEMSSALRTGRAAVESLQQTAQQGAATTEAAATVAGVADVAAPPSADLTIEPESLPVSGSYSEETVGPLDAPTIESPELQRLGTVAVEAGHPQALVDSVIASDDATLAAHAANNLKPTIAALAQGVQLERAAAVAPAPTNTFPNAQEISVAAANDATLSVTTREAIKQLANHRIDQDSTLNIANTVARMSGDSSGPRINRPRNIPQATWDNFVTAAQDQTGVMVPRTNSHNRTVRDNLLDIASNGSRPGRLLAQRLLDTGNPNLDMMVEQMVEPPPPAAGAKHSITRGRILSAPDGEVTRFQMSSVNGTESALLHETLHAVTMRWLSTAQTTDPLYRELLDLTNKVKAEADRRGIQPYGTHQEGVTQDRIRMSEFLAEAFTRGSFQQFLDTIPVSSSRTAWTAFRDWVAKITGSTGTRGDLTALDLALRLNEDVMTRSTEADVALRAPAATPEPAPEPAPAPAPAAAAAAPAPAPADTPAVLDAITRLRERAQRDGTPTSDINRVIAGAREDVSNLSRDNVDRTITSLENNNDHGLAYLYRSLQAATRTPAATPTGDDASRAAATPEPAPAPTVYPDALASARESWLSQTGNDPARADFIESMDRAALEGIAAETRRPRLVTYARAILDHAAAGHPTRMTEQPAGSPEVVAAIARLREVDRQNGDGAMRTEDIISDARDAVRDETIGQLDREVAALENANQNSLASLYRALMAERTAASAATPDQTANTPTGDDASRAADLLTAREAAIQMEMDRYGFSRQDAEDEITAMEDSLFRDDADHIEHRIRRIQGTGAWGAPREAFMRAILNVRRAGFDSAADAGAAAPESNHTAALRQGALDAYVAEGASPTEAEQYATELENYSDADLRNNAFSSSPGEDPIADYAMHLLDQRTMLVGNGAPAATPESAIDEGARLRQAVLDYYRGYYGSSNPEALVASLERYNAAELGLVGHNQGVDPAVAEYARYLLRSRSPAAAPAPAPAPAPTLTPGQRAARTRAQNRFMAYLPTAYGTTHGPTTDSNRQSRSETLRRAVTHTIRRLERHPHANLSVERDRAVRGVFNAMGAEAEQWLIARIHGQYGTSATPTTAPTAAPLGAAAASLANYNADVVAADTELQQRGHATMNGQTLDRGFMESTSDLPAVISHARSNGLSRTLALALAIENRNAAEEGRTPQHPRFVPTATTRASAPPVSTVVGTDAFPTRARRMLGTGVLEKLVNFWRGVMGEPGQWTMGDIDISDLIGHDTQASADELARRYNDRLHEKAVEWAREHGEPEPAYAQVVLGITNSDIRPRGSVELDTRGLARRGNPFLPQLTPVPVIPGYTWRESTNGNVYFDTQIHASSLASTPGSGDFLYRIAADMARIKGGPGFPSDTTLSTVNNLRRQMQGVAANLRTGNPNLINPLNSAGGEAPQAISPAIWNAASDEEKIGLSILRTIESVIGHRGDNYPSFGKIYSNLRLQPDGTFLAVGAPNPGGVADGTTLTFAQLKDLVSSSRSFVSDDTASYRRGGVGAGAASFAIAANTVAEALENDINTTLPDTLLGPIADLGRANAGWFFSEDGAVPSDPAVADSPAGQIATITALVSPPSRAEMEIIPTKGLSWFEELNEKLAKVWQNKDVVLKRILQTLNNTKPLELMDTFSGRAETSLRLLIKKPMAEIERTLMLGLINRAQFDEYLKMRHAEEYNRQIMKINPLQLDAQGRYVRGFDMEAHPGSGIKTSAARAYMAGTHKPAMVNAARLYDAMNRGLQQFAVERGLEEQSTIDAWNVMFPNYTPFRRSLDSENEFSRTGTGSGFSVRQGISRAALGSSEEILSPLVATLQQAASIITRGEKATIGQAMLGVAMHAPIPMFRTKGGALKPMWKVDTMPNIRTKKRLRVYQIQGANGVVPNIEFYNANEARSYARLQTRNDPANPLTVKDGGVQERVVSAHNPAYINNDNVLVIPVKGKNHVLVFDEDSEDAVSMVRNLKNLDSGQVDGFFKVTNQFSRFTVATATGYNPFFAPLNFLRDIQASAINIISAGIPGWGKTDSVKLMGNAVKNIKPLLAHLQREHEALHGNTGPNTVTNKTVAMLERAQRAGGLTGINESFSNYEDALRSTQHLFGEAITEDTDPRVRQHALRKAGGAVEGAIDAAGRFLDGDVASDKKVLKALSNVPVAISNLNNAFELATRLAAFEMAFNKFRATGMSEADAEAKAAIVSKNVSVNFNRRGQWSSRANALFPFFNASAQGSARLAELMFKKVQVKNKSGAYEQKTELTPVGLKVALALPALGVLQALMLAAAGYEDDQPPEWIKARNFVIPTGNKQYLAIPLPLGLNALFNMGREGMNMGLHPENMGKHLKNAIFEIPSAFNPLGSTPNVMLQATPAIADIPVALLMNKDFADRSIFKTDRDPRKPTPGFTRNKEGTSDLSISIAKALNTISGGNDYRPGAINITGDQVEYVAGQLGGGVTREVMKAGQFALGNQTSEDRPWFKVPLVGKFVGSVGDSAAVREQLYTSSAELNILNAEYKGLREDKKFAEAEAFLKKNPEVRLHDDFDRYFNAEGKKRKERTALQRKGDGEAVANINTDLRTKGEKLLAEVKRLKGQMN